MEIDDFTIRKLSLVLAIAGVLAVFAIVIFSQPAVMKVKGIGEADIGKKVVIKGIVTSAFQRKNALMFGIFDGKEIKAVKFSPGIEDKIAVMKGNQLKVTGIVQKYGKELEIVVEKIYSVD